MTRVLTPAKIGELSVAISYAAIDAGLDPKNVVAAWAEIGAAMPLAVDLVGLAVQRRPAISADVREMVDRIREQERTA